MDLDRSALDEALDGVTARFDRRYWLDCCRTGTFPADLWEAMAKADLLGVGIPPEYGGIGGGVTEACVVQERLARAGMPSFFFVLMGICGQVIVTHASEEQRRAWLPGSVAGELKFAFAITEPDAGTNTFAIETTAVRDASGGFVLNGRKVFISGANEADHMIVVTRTRSLEEVADRREGFTLLVVDPKSPGIEMHPLNIAVPSPDRQFSVFFTDVAVPGHAVIGEEGRAFEYLWSVLNPERLLSAATQVGLGAYALEKAVAYAKERAPFGRPLGAYQAIQHPMAHARASLDAARLMTYHACERYDRGESAGAEANMAKLLASEASVEACEIAIQVHGGYGFDADYDVITLWPLARLGKVGPVNNEMILNFIGEHVLGLPKSY